MLKPERQAFIIKQLNIHNKVLSSDLSLQLDVSEDTVRRDLHELSEIGQVIKVHGGAISPSYHYAYQQADVYASSEKKVIAKKAAALVQDGMYVLVGGGTTIREVIKALPTDLKATFFTVSLLSALQLIEHPNIEVIFLGGQLSKNAQISVGGEVIRQLNDIHADLCLLGTNSIDIKEGITDSDWEVVQVKKSMIQAADQFVALSISEKLNSVQRMKVCPTNTVNTLITELAPDDEHLKWYKKMIRQIL